MIFKLTVISLLLGLAVAEVAEPVPHPAIGRPLSLPGRIIRPPFHPHPPIFRTFPPPIIRHPTLGPQMTTPSMVDANMSFVKPSDFAKDCLNAMGASLVSKCQNQAQADWDPAKLNTSTETTWESCCSVFDELNCYVQNAHTFCPASTQQAVMAYSRKVGRYFQYSICRSVSFVGWKTSCNNATHQANAARLNKTIDNNPKIKPSFVNLPPEDGPEKVCFRKLRTAKEGNLEKKCEDTSLNKWDPTRRKLMESAILESCCATFEIMDCAEKHSKSVCSAGEQKDLLAYTTKAKVAFKAQLCQNVNMKLCSKPSGAGGLLPSAVGLMVALLSSITFLFRAFN